MLKKSCLPVEKCVQWQMSKVTEVCFVTTRERVHYTLLRKYLIHLEQKTYFLCVSTLVNLHDLLHSTVSSVLSGIWLPKNVKVYSWSHSEGLSQILEGVCLCNPLCKNGNVTLNKPYVNQVTLRDKIHLKGHASPLS